MGRWDLPVVLGGIPSQAGRAEGVQPGERKAPGDLRVPFRAERGSKRAEEVLCTRAWRHKTRYNDLLLPESRIGGTLGRNPSL